MKRPGFLGPSGTARQDQAQSQDGSVNWVELESSTIALEWRWTTRLDDSGHGVIIRQWTRRPPGMPEVRRILQAALTGLNTLKDPYFLSQETLPVLRTLVAQRGQLARLEDLREPITLTPADPHFFAVLGVEESRWVFQLFHHWRDLLGQRVPVQVDLFRSDEDQIGVSWTFKDCTKEMCQQLRKNIMDAVKYKTGDSSGKRPRPDDEDEEPGAKRKGKQPMRDSAPQQPGSH